MNTASGPENQRKLAQTMSTKRLSASRAKKYMADDDEDGYCPECRSKQIELSAADLIDCYAVQVGLCHACNVEWSVVYRFVEIMLHEPDEGCQKDDTQPVPSGLVEGRPCIVAEKSLSQEDLASLVQEYQRCLSVWHSEVAYFDRMIEAWASLVPSPKEIGRASCRERVYVLV